MDLTIFLRPIKFWELMVSTPVDVRSKVLETEKWMNPYSEYNRNFDALVQRQVRHILDQFVPVQLSREMISAISDEGYYFQLNYGLRRRKMHDSDVPVTALKIHDILGGAVLPEIDEYGSCPVPEHLRQLLIS